MRLVFLGTPDFACASLAALVEAGHDVALVVTQPDKPRGRGRAPSPTPVRSLAQSRGLIHCTLERGGRAEVYQRILEQRPQLIVVVAFGHLVREPLLSAPPHGCVNVHASLLPRWRGAAPIHRALLAGDQRTGVTTMRLTAGLDEGPIYLTEATVIGPDETTAQLHDRLAPLGAGLLLRTLEGLTAGTLRGVPQDDQLATWAPALRKDEGTVDFAWPARRVHDTVRALESWPKVTVLHRDRRLALGGSRLSPPVQGKDPAREAGNDAVCAATVGVGRVRQIGPADMEVSCEQGSVRLSRVLPEGGRWMDPASYARGHGLAVGDVLRPLPAERT